MPRAVADRGGGRILSNHSKVLWGVLTGAYAQLGFDAVQDEAFAAMVLARIVEPTSKADTVRVLGELGVRCPSLRTLFRSLQRCQERDYRDVVAKACLAHSARTTGQAALIMYDVTTLHFENEDEDSLRKVGMSKEHRVDPQVQVGLLVDPGGFPLEVRLFEGNKAETTTLVPVLTSFQERHGVSDMVVVADAGMLSRATWLPSRMRGSPSSSAPVSPRPRTTWRITSGARAPTSAMGRSWSPPGRWAPGRPPGNAVSCTSGPSSEASVMTARST